MTTPGSPTVRRRRLAAELRAIRERRGENLQTVAAGLGWSTSKLSRYELGSGLKREEVARLLDHYQVTGVLREHLLDLAREASRKGWWEEYSDVSSAEYREFIGLEAEARAIAVWHVEVVTGLLQTEGYARALLAEYSKVEPIAPAIIDRRVELRMRRKQVLERDPPLDLLVVLDESVLKRQFGDESVMYEQLRWLVAESERPSVTLRVLPLRAPHPVSAESFVIFSFGPKDDAILHDVVASEGLKESFYIEDAQDTYLHLLVFDTLLEATLDAAASRDLIVQTAEDHWRGLGASMDNVLGPEGTIEKVAVSPWIKSSLSHANGNCVEIADLADSQVGMRDSKHADGHVLQFPREEWRAFLNGARNGEFDNFPA